MKCRVAVSNKCRSRGVVCIVICTYGTRLVVMEIGLGVDVGKDEG